MDEYQSYARDMLDFIEKSPSCFHAVDNIRQSLLQDGFVELRERDAWQTAPGGGYFVTREDASIIAFRLPSQKAASGFHIIASHSDSPAFQVKEAPEMAVEGRYVKLNIEKYGGAILSTWLDRALSVAGRIAVGARADDAEAGGIADKTAGGIMTRLVNLDRDLLVIPNLAIHLNRDINKGIEYNPQTDMLPLFAGCPEDAAGNGAPGNHTLLSDIAEAAGVRAEDILGHDLFLYVRDKGRIWGENAEFILSPRLDDLQCVYASVRAFRESIPKESVNVCAVFDNEEVGSATRQGADSTFLEDVLVRVSSGLGDDRGAYLRRIADSFLISADNAHAVHPNHPDKSDPTNRPYLNGGIVIKRHGSRKYATDAASAAKMKHICQKAGVPWQTYANRSDIAGGSTLGNISSSHVSVSCVDVGLPQLAMHSAMETAGVRDTLYAVKAFRAFYEN